MPFFVENDLTALGMNYIEVNLSMVQCVWNMKTLIDYGVSFSLDDFGTGQSNLYYITLNFA